MVMETAPDAGLLLRARLETPREYESCFVIEAALGVEIAIGESRVLLVATRAIVHEDEIQSVDGELVTDRLTCDATSCCCINNVTL